MKSVWGIDIMVRCRHALSKDLDLQKQTKGNTILTLGLRIPHNGPTNALEFGANVGVIYLLAALWPGSLQD